MTVQRLHLEPQLREALGDDPFEKVMSLQGEVFREHKHRRTFRASIGGQDYFVKVHGHAGWREILKDRARARVPVVTADAEWRALQRCRELNIPSIEPVGYGTRGTDEAHRESFIITRPLDGYIHLDEVASRMSNWPRVSRYRFKRRMIFESAHIARSLHANGMNHRDLYLCHFMLPDRPWQDLERNDRLDLHVIDLHRVQLRDSTPRRWVAKDLGGLLFSSLDLPLSGADCIRFLRAYGGDGWRNLLSQRGLLKRIRNRAMRQYRAHHGKPAQVSAGLASF